MAKVKNSHDRALGLPNGTVIGSGEAVDVPGWDKLSKHKVVAKWLAANVLSAVKSEKSDPAPEPEAEAESDSESAEESSEAEEESEQEEESEDADENEQKEALIAQLKELDIKPDKRSSVEKLQEKLDEALAK